ncbi:MAG TPA: hypothetical protein VIG69_04100 [Candidatus Methylomirabilis sp.]|jgi:hypothetical protein
MKRAVASIALLAALVLLPAGRASAWWPRGSGYRVCHAGRHHAYIFSLGVPFGYGYPVYTSPPIYYVPPPVVYPQPPVYPSTNPTGRWEWRCDGGFCRWVWVPA